MYYVSRFSASPLRWRGALIHLSTKYFKKHGEESPCLCRACIHVLGRGPAKARLRKTRPTEIGYTSLFASNFSIFGRTVDSRYMTPGHGERGPGLTCGRFVS